MIGYNSLKNKIKIRDKKTGNVFMGLVHRLDRPVGGVMVLPKPLMRDASEQIRKEPSQNILSCYSRKTAGERRCASRYFAKR